MPAVFLIVGMIHAVSARYRQWSAAARGVLEVNRGIRNSGGKAVDARMLHDACVQSLAPADVNVDDLKEAFDRLERYNRAYAKIIRSKTPPA